MGEGTPTGRSWWRSSGSPRLAPAELHAAALGMLFTRRAIRGTLPPDLVHDPALEMLLHLYVGQPAPVAATELAERTTVSRVVAGHWLAALCQEGLVAAAGERVALTDGGAAAMESMLAAVIDAQRPVPGCGNR